MKYQTSSSRASNVLMSTGWWTTFLKPCAWKPDARRISSATSIVHTPRNSSLYHVKIYFEVHIYVDISPGNIAGLQRGEGGLACANIYSAENDPTSSSPPALLTLRVLPSTDGRKIHSSQLLDGRRDPVWSIFKCSRDQKSSERCRRHDRERGYAAGTRSTSQ